MLLPICFLAAVLNYLDRSNLAFAALELNADLGFTPVVRVDELGVCAHAPLDGMHVSLHAQTRSTAAGCQ